jgi:hypothetical protein
MPLTKQQLLIPRVLCIGGEQGKPNDTSGDYITGDILTQTVKSIHKWKSEKLKHSVYFCDKWIEQFPHLFKPLPWWYGRTVEEMPEYVKNTDILSMNNGKVYKVIKHEDNFVYLEVVPVLRNNPRFHIENFEPADISDYQEYQKQKEA